MRWRLQIKQVRSSISNYLQVIDLYLTSYCIKCNDIHRKTIKHVSSWSNTIFTLSLNHFCYLLSSYYTSLNHQFNLLIITIHSKPFLSSSYNPSLNLNHPPGGNIETVATGGRLVICSSARWQNHHQHHQQHPSSSVIIMRLAPPQHPHSPHQPCPPSSSSLLR